MKYRQFYEHLLLEAISHLYHLTGVKSLISMLKEDRILLSFSGSTRSDYEINSGKNFFLSTSREKYSGYGRGQYDRHDHIAYPVNIVLDGNAIERTRGMYLKSVDYWGKELGDLRVGSNETEERIISDEHQLKGLSRYVKEIHVYCPQNMNGYKKHEYSELIESFKSKNIPVYFYIGVDNKINQAYKLQAKQYSVDLDSFERTFREQFKDVTPEVPFNFRADDTDSKKVKSLLDIAENPDKYIDYSKVEPNTNRLISTMMGPESYSILVNTTKNKIRDELYLLSKEAQRQGFSDVNKFIQHMGDKIRTLRYILDHITRYNESPKKDLANLIKNLSERMNVSRSKLGNLVDKIESKVGQSKEVDMSPSDILELYEEFAE
jgi:hypothetical protein